MKSATLHNRRLIRISGEEARAFLQGLITNDIARLEPGAPLYAALLTPQGKYLADFMLVASDDDILIDAAADQAEPLMRRLSMYKLRRKVALALDERPVTTIWDCDAPPKSALRDPRHLELGWRLYEDFSAANDDYDLHRLQLGVPEAGVDLTPDSFILEAGFERLNGVDFKKGCYVGQEVTARMKHKLELRKGLRKVMVAGEAPPGTPLVNEEDKLAGTLYSNRDGIGLAQLRLERAGGEMRAGEARVRLAP